MGWVYIIVRTYPFWAIPTALTLFAGWYNARRRRRPLPFYWVLICLALIGSSVYFLMNQGHIKAVPAMHSIFNGESPEPR